MGIRNTNMELLSGISPVVAYGITTVTTFGVGANGDIWRRRFNLDQVAEVIDSLQKKLGTMTNKQVSEMYDTLITPSGWAFGIWGPIFALEGASVLWPSSPVHLASAAPWWAGACLSQAAWSLCCSQGRVITCMAPMLGIGYSLHGLCNTLPREPAALSCGYILGRLPFVMHFSWVCCATVLNANLAAVAVAGKGLPDNGYLLWLARGSLVAATAVGGSLAYSGSDAVPAFVTAWANRNLVKSNLESFDIKIREAKEPS